MVYFPKGIVVVKILISVLQYQYQPIVVTNIPPCPCLYTSFLTVTYSFYLPLYQLLTWMKWRSHSTNLDKDTMRLNSPVGISNNILFLVCIFLTSQKFEVHSHEGSMSNMVTNTDKQQNIQREVDPGNLGLQICCVFVLNGLCWCKQNVGICCQLSTRYKML